jgi:CheY-like chemotaxis protein
MKVARIIVIEDETAIGSLVRRILGGRGHDVGVAANGRDGVALHRADPAELVITDLFMPEQDGIETIQQIREFAPGARGQPPARLTPAPAAAGTPPRPGADPTVRHLGETGLIRQGGAPRDHCATTGAPP